jgi:multiple sugar transport system permease protein
MTTTVTKAPTPAPQNITVRPAGEKRAREQRLQKIGVSIALVIGSLFAGFPVFWMLSSSFKANSEIFQFPPRIITENFSFDANTTILGDPSRCGSSSTATWCPSR